MDMCMCAGGDCPQKAQCLRFTGVVYGRQDFFGTPPYINDPMGFCPFFVDDRPSEGVIRQQAYAFWESEGCPHGKDAVYWLRAEAYLLALKRSGG